MQKDRFEYQKYNRYFAQAAGKMENLCADELRELGAKKIKTAYRGVYFHADLKTLFKINYMSRLCTKIFAPLLTFSCHSDRYLKNTARKIKWDLFLNLEKTFAITSNVSNSKIRHSKYAALCLKDAIADYFTAKFNKRPNVDTKNPDIWFHLHIENNRAIISLNLSGESLHKRGYRLSATEAPMQETLAAALIRISRWNGEKPLLDLMCGSGTIICETLMHYCKIPPQYLRKDFGFFHLPDYNEQDWLQIKKQCDNNIRPLPENLIYANDKSKQAIEIIKQNGKHLPYFDNVNVKNKPFQNLEKFENSVIITNPPYGIRIGNKDNVKKLYNGLGSYLKEKCKGTTAYIYVGDKSLVKSIGLKPSHRTPLVNGAIQGELLEIEVY